MIFAREEKQQQYLPFILHRLCDFKKYKQVFFQTMEIRDDFSIVDLMLLILFLISELLGIQKKHQVNGVIDAIIKAGGSLNGSIRRRESDSSSDHD